VVLSGFDGDEALSLTGLLLQACSGLARAAGDEPRLGEVDSLPESAAVQLEEALALLGRIRDDLDLDPERFEELERRLTRVHDLARKHRLPVAELAAHRDAIAAELELLRSAGDRLLQLDAEIAKASARWQEAAAALGATRRAAGEALAAATTALIDELGMGGGRFLV